MPRPSSFPSPRHGAPQLSSDGGANGEVEKDTGDALPVINPAAAAIDVGSRFRVVAVPSALCKEPVQAFQAFTGDLQRMGDLLKALGITTVVMETIGAYKVAIYEVLESFSIGVIVVNARGAKSMTGRESDVNDAQWLQRLYESPMAAQADCSRSTGRTFSFT